MKFKILLPLLLCSTFFNVNNTSAQQVINGGFEPAMGLSACNDIDVKVYNHNMGNNWSAGDATLMQIANSSCSQGSPVSGTYFGVLKYAPPGEGNAIVFKLDKPMTANTAYSFTLSYKIPSATTVTGGLRFGYTADSLSADSVSGTTNPITTTSWKKDTIVITPKKQCQYIWIQVSALGGDPFTVHVDDVNALKGSTSVKTVTAQKGMTVFPNPFTDQTSLTFDNAMKLPYSVMIYDVSGRLIFKRTEVQSNKFIINKGSMNTGLYMLQVIDSENNIRTSRLVVQ